jgi:hypothetical protein
VPCIGDGTSGSRVRAIYAYPAGKKSRYAEVADDSTRCHSCHGSEDARRQPAAEPSQRRSRVESGAMLEEPESRVSEPGVCEACHRVMREVEGCSVSAVKIGETLFERVAYGREREDWGAAEAPCHDCGAEAGRFHTGPATSGSVRAAAASCSPAGATRASRRDCSFLSGARSHTLLAGRRPPNSTGRSFGPPRGGPSRRAKRRRTRALDRPQARR